MEKLNNKNFTRNMFFLTFKDKVTADLYYKSVYSFGKMLIASLMTYGLVIVNMILLHVIEENQNKTGIKHMEIILLVIEGLLILSFIIWKIVTNRQKNDTYFYPAYTLISAMNMLNVYLQPFITREGITNSSNALTLMALIPVFQFFSIMVFLIFIENNFIIYFANFILTIALIFSLSININWHFSILIPLFQLIGGFLFCFFAYFVNKRDKIQFILFRNATTELEKKNSLFENLNSGLVTIDENGCDYNRKIKDYLDINSNLKSLTTLNLIDQKLTLNNNDTYTPLNNNYSLNLGIINLLFENYLEINPAIDNKMKQIFQRSKNLFSYEKNDEDINVQCDKKVTDLKQLMKLDDVYQSYMHIGDKVINKSASINKNFNHKDTLFTLRIYLRYNQTSSTLEFLLDDISSVIEVEKMKASQKYKKLFLNKFSHEFKNPLLNTIQLISDLKRKIRETNSFSNVESLTRLSALFKNSKLQEQYNLPFSLEASAYKIYSNTCNKDFKEIKYIKDSTRHLISLIEDFDFISNRETLQPITQNQIDNTKPQLKSPIGKSFIEISKFRLPKIIKQCVSILQTKIDLSEKNIKVTSKIDENIPYEIFSDYRRLKQVISNLLSNALKFTLMGEISITVRKDDLNDNLINFEICDTGMGFKEDILQMIQEGNTHLLFGNINTGGNIYGCGLGLGLVENIISKIGENFKINSQIDEGSKITFSIHYEVENENEAVTTSNLKTNKSLKSCKPIIINILSSQNEKSNCSINKRENTIRRSITLKNTESKFLTLNTPQDKAIKFTNNDNESNTNIISKQNAPIKIKRKFSIVKITSIKEVELKFNQDENEGFSLELEKPICEEIINFQDELYNVNYSNTDEDIDKTFVIDGPLRAGLRHILENNQSKDMDFDLSLSRSKTVKLNNSLKLDRSIENDICLSIGSEGNKERSESIRFKNKSSESNSLSLKPMIRILLVDDEKLIRQSESNQIKKFFKSKSEFEHQIIECSDGVECLYHIYKGIQEGIKYDYIITDESMNFMRGTVMIKALNTLIAENIMYNIKRYIVTSYEPWAITNTHGNICDGIISKPLTFGNISTIFENRINKNLY